MADADKKKNKKLFEAKDRGGGGEEGKGGEGVIRNYKSWTRLMLYVQYSGEIRLGRESPCEAGERRAKRGRRASLGGRRLRAPVRSPACSGYQERTERLFVGWSVYSKRRVGILGRSTRGLTTNIALLLYTMLLAFICILICTDIYVCMCIYRCIYVHARCALVHLRRLGILIFISIIKNFFHIFIYLTIIMSCNKMFFNSK